MSIGKNCFIGDPVFIREGVKIGDNSIIGTFVAIESNAIIGKNVTIQPFSIIARDMVIENDVFIGPHFSCADAPYVADGEHGLSKNKKSVKQKTIIIQEGARLGTSGSLAPGGTIGHHIFIKMITQTTIFLRSISGFTASIAKIY